MRFLPLALAATIALGTPGFAQETTTTETEAAVEYDAATVLARVNGKDITLGNVIALLERLPERYLELEDDVLFPGMLDQLIDQALIADTISAEAETDSKRVKLILENERYALLSNRAISDLTANGPTDAELQEAYDAAYGDIEAKPEYSASHILVETAEEAQAVIEEVNGGADFAEVAKEKSTGPSGPNGGDLGWFGAGVMVPEFEAALTGMEVGGISEPVQTQFGWHVIKLNETRDVPPPSLDDTREELAQQIVQKNVEVAIDEMRAAATIERVEIEVPAGAIREADLLNEAAE